MTWSRLLLAAAAGGILSVDRKAFLQAGLSRPLVACAVVGACLDALPAGLLVGAPLELLFLGSANLGAARVDNETLVACAIAAASGFAARTLGKASLPAASLALLMLMPFVLLGRGADRLEQRVQQRIADQALGLMERGQYRAALRRNWRSLWFPFAVGAITTLLGCAIGAALARVLPQVPTHGLRALEAAFLFASGICAAAAVRGSRHPRAVSLALISAGVTLVAVIWAR